jgi:coenzyme F420 hydrogenase subunit beta
VGLRAENLLHVVERQLCCGCGACAYFSPDAIEMVDDIDQGRRPLMRNGPAAAGEAMQVCPGIVLSHDFDQRDPELIRELTSAWGPVRQVWEGYAADPEIRFAGSSGGAATALALYCIERLGMHGVLHIAARRDVPYLNETVLSTSREELLARTGSRYAPASPCDGLQMIEDAPGPCVFIGKPCDVAAVQKARKLRPRLDAKIGLTIAIFCAGTPTTRGTLELLKRLGVDDPATVESIRYRGKGWPGRWRFRFRDGAGEPHERSLSYEESWGQLARHKQWRCHICPDHSGEFADVSVGDPWYRSIPLGEPGRSLVMARTPVGVDAIRSAMEAGALTLDRADPRIVAASQPNLLRARGSVWGRLFAMRLARVPRPRYERLPMLRHWFGALSLSDKARSVFGTWRRIGRRGLLHPRPVVPHEPGSSKQMVRSVEASVHTEAHR